MGSISESNLGLAPSSEHETLQLALESACARYTENNPVSQAIHYESCKYMPGGNTRTTLYVSPFPMTIEHGESCYLTTVDGQKYVDFLGEYTAGVYGHNNPVIKKAVEEALSRGWNYGGHSRMEQKLAKTVCERFPAMELLRFVNSGTEANMMALATSVLYTGRKGVLIFYGGYHGGTISGKQHLSKPNVNLPHEFVMGKYNDVQGTRSLVDSVKDNLAAIIVEPMMGSGGCFPAKPEFLQMLREVATQHGIILIFDEVMTSRLSYNGLGHAQGVTPDLMTLGKWIGGGMTFGAFGGREDIMKMYDPRISDLAHAGTFNNNVFTMSAGVAGCELLNKDKVFKLNALGDSMRVALQMIFDKYSITGSIPEAPVIEDQHSSIRETRPPKMFVTGRGSLMNVQFSGQERLLFQGLYYQHMVDHGIYMASRGFVALNIEMNQTHIDKFVDATDRFCQQYHQFLKS